MPSFPPPVHGLDDADPLLARSHSTLKFIAISLPIGTGLIYVCCFYIAMVGAATRPDYPAPEAIYPAMIVEVLPQWLLLVAILAIVAATGSTANSIVLTLSSIVAKEHVRPVLARRGASDRSMDRTLTVTTRVMLPVLVGGGLLVAFFGPDSIIGIIVSITWPAVFLIFPALLAGLYWRRATAPGAVASMVASETVFLSLDQGWLPIPLAGWHPAMPAAILGVAVLVVLSLLTRPPAQEHLDRHFALFEEPSTTTQPPDRRVHARSSTSNGNYSDGATRSIVTPSGSLSPRTQRGNPGETSVRAHSGLRMGILMTRG